jgi:hypothetical protein
MGGFLFYSHFQNNFFSNGILGQGKLTALLSANVNGLSASWLLVTH